MHSKKNEINFDEILMNTIITALEGGSNYWYWLNCEEIWYKNAINYDKKNALFTNRLSYWSLSERIGRCLLELQNFELPIYDYEEPTELLGVLNLEKFNAALLICKEKFNRTYINLITEEYDATDADVLFQLAVMGELVYG